MEQRAVRFPRPAERGEVDTVKLRSYLAAAAMKLGLPADIAAGLPHMEVNGFQECSVDRHTGILEYNEERIVVGHALQIQRMHRERLTITGRITCLTYGDGGTAGCGG